MPSLPPRASAPDHPRPRLAFACGSLALAGCAAVLATDIAGWFVVDGYDPIAETISDLGAGRYATVQDLGLTGFAVALAAIAVGLAPLAPHSRRFVAGLVLLGLVLVPVVLLIAWHNAYGDYRFGDFTMHRELTWVLWLAFAVAAFLLAKALGARHHRLGQASRWIAVAWFVGAPLYEFTPNGWDGAVERALTMLPRSWAVATGLSLLRGAWR